MQSQKKCRREPRIKTEARTFALQYSMNVGDVTKAIQNAEHLESVCRNKATELDDKKYLEEIKRLNHTANFWMNVVGILKKHRGSKGKKNGSNRTQVLHGGPNQTVVPPTGR